MKFKFALRTSVFALASLFGLSLASSPAELLYELKFQDGSNESLANTGSIGGTAVDVNNGGDFVGEFTSDLPPTEGNVWAYSLASNGIQGVFLLLPDCGDKLRLTGEADQMTIAMWVKLDGDAQRPDGLVATQSSAEGGSGWAFSVNNETNKLQFTVDGNVVDYPVTRTYPGEAAVPSGTWTHVAVVYNDNIANFYIDGSWVGAGTPFGCFPEHNSLPIRVGTVLEVSGPLDGMVDDVVIHDSALSEDEIASLAKTREH